jgi:hypothetical protein
MPVCMPVVRQGLGRYPPASGSLWDLPVEPQLEAELFRQGLTQQHPISW